MTIKKTTTITVAHNPVLTVPSKVEFKIEGEIGRRLKAVTEQWILPAPDANPAMLAMFRDRDRKPYRKMVAWAGEFAGKYLTHSVQILRLTGDAQLRSHLEQFVKELCACQASDGYLGCWPQDSRLTNHASNSAHKWETWDTWAHYHTMLGLILWNEVSGDDAALNAAVRIADLFCDIYLDKKTPRLVETGSTEMNLAPIHSLCLLYKKTGSPRHLALARQILSEFSAKDSEGKFLAGDYLNAPLAGQKFCETPKPRWESLHPIMGMVELYWLTGDESCRKAFESLWWSMLKGDRHNNGGFSSGEKATGNPYDTGAIETCCTVAWMAMSVEMLRLTGCSLVADELELSMLNSGLGMMSPSGRWVTYDTPMDGERKASAHHIVFQSRAGSPELNCCSVNGPRALGLLCEWALMRNGEGLALNYYGSGTMKTDLQSGNTVSIKQDTDYPRNAVINLAISTAKAENFALALRVPYWSRKTSVRINGKEINNVKHGEYLRISREWKSGDTVRIEMDFGLQFWRHPAKIHVSGSHAWETEWRLGGVIPNRANSPAGLSPVDLLLDGAVSMADVTRMTGGHPASVPSTSGHIDFKKIFSEAGAHAAAWCFTEIDVPSDGILPVMFGCDWWCSCFVNGQTIVSNESGSTERAFHIPLPMKAGVNLIGFRITAGSGGWTLSIAKGAFVPKGKEVQLLRYASIYRGPVLLAYDARFNDGDFSSETVPPLAAPALKLLPEWSTLPSDTPLLLFEGKDANGKSIRYCDFASAGATGNYYQSWVPVGFQSPEVEFSLENPRRS